MPFQNFVAEINLGQDGLNGTKNRSLLMPTELLIANNVEYSGGVVSKEGGAVKHNSTPVTGTILAGIDWYPNLSTQRQVIFTSSGYIYKATGSTYAAIKTGLSGNHIPTFCEGGQETLAASRKLFIFNGNDAVQVLTADGVVTTALATPPADWASTNQPVCGAIHEGRLWGALNHRVYYSTTASHEDFTGAGSGQIAIHPGVGNRILQIMSFKGVLLIFKEPHGIFLIDTSQVDPSNWKVSALNLGLGVPSSWAACQIDDDIVFMDTTGSIQLLSGVELFNITGANISQTRQMDNWIRENVNVAQLVHMKAIFYPAKREVHFGVPQTSIAYNNARLVLDLNVPNRPRFRWSDRDVCEALWLRKDSTGIPRLTVGDENGYVWLLDQDTRSKDSAGYLGEFQTPHMDFGWVDGTLSAKQKLGDSIEIVAEPRDGITLYVDVIWDGNLRHTITFSLNAQGTPLGEFVLGTDQLGSAQLLSIRKKRLLGSGRRLSLRFYNSGAGDDFALARAFVRFKAGNERINHTSD